MSKIHESAVAWEAKRLNEMKTAAAATIPELDNLTAVCSKIGDRIDRHEFSAAAERFRRAGVEQNKAVYYWMLAVRQTVRTDPTQTVRAPGTLDASTYKPPKVNHLRLKTEVTCPSAKVKGLITRLDDVRSRLLRALIEADVAYVTFATLSHYRDSIELTSFEKYMDEFHRARVKVDELQDEALSLQSELLAAARDGTEWLQVTFVRE